jgi:uncharacterized Ntn-hydrolase superfamily protein
LCCRFHPLSEPESGSTGRECRDWSTRPANERHGHPYAVRGLVLAGTFTVTLANDSKTYRPGEIFSVEAGLEHSEEIGADGAEVLVGRRY